MRNFISFPAICILFLSAINSSVASNLSEALKPTLNGVEWSCWQLVSVNEKTRSSSSDHIHSSKWIKSSNTSPGKHVPPLEPGYGDLRSTLNNVKQVGKSQSVKRYAFTPQKGTSYTKDFPDDGMVGRFLLDKSRNLIAKVAVEARNVSHGPVTLHKIEYVWEFTASKEGFPLLRRIIRSFDGTAFFFKNFKERILTEFLNPKFEKKAHCK